MKQQFFVILEGEELDSSFLEEMYGVKVQNLNGFIKIIGKYSNVVKLIVETNYDSDLYDMITNIKPIEG